MKILRKRKQINYLNLYRALFLVVIIRCDQINWCNDITTTWYEFSSTLLESHINHNICTMSRVIHPS